MRWYIICDVTKPLTECMSILPENYIPWCDERFYYRYNLESDHESRLAALSGLREYLALMIWLNGWPRSVLDEFGGPDGLDLPEPYKPDTERDDCIWREQFEEDRELEQARRWQPQPPPRR